MIFKTVLLKICDIISIDINRNSSVKSHPNKKTPNREIALRKV